MIRTFFAGLALFAVAILSPWTIAAGEGKQTVRLLNVGNSFSQNATRHLNGLVQAAGRVLVHGQAVIGGSTMAQHLEKAERHEKDPQDKQGLYSTQKSLKQYLLAEPWDVITIQQASIRSHDVETYRPSARLIYDYIKKYAPKSEVVIHQTWAYRVDDPRFTVAEPKPGEPATQEAMYRGLTNAYKTIATELNVRRFPVGDAFHLADTDPAWGFRPDKTFDVKAAKHPALPDQTHSLHVGWRWVKQADDSFKLTMDGHHANIAGEYLGGCVFYEMLLEASPVGNEFVPAGLDRKYARFLQETAHRAVAAVRKK